MGYGDFKANVTTPIAEREYCVRDHIDTTAVTSCIVLVSPVGSKLFGIHLSVVGESDVFGEHDAEKVVDILRSTGADLNNVRLFGEVDFWSDSIPGYKYLRSKLTIKDECRRSGSLSVTAKDLGGVS